MKKTALGVLTSALISISTFATAEDVQYLDFDETEFSLMSGLNITDENQLFDYEPIDISSTSSVEEALLSPAGDIANDKTVIHNFVFTVNDSEILRFTPQEPMLDRIEKPYLYPYRFTLKVCAETPAVRLLYTDHFKFAVVINGQNSKQEKDWGNFELNITPDQLCDEKEFSFLTTSLKDRFQVYGMRKLSLEEIATKQLLESIENKY
ncbi:hypothetical protein [Vibrio astriarenae]|uniref:hypothetical protein n=1 Tax=Vibrio astriarenae TaxID=1481923 RepID=UPI00373545B7